MKDLSYVDVGHVEIDSSFDKCIDVARVFGFLFGGAFLFHNLGRLNEIGLYDYVEAVCDFTEASTVFGLGGAYCLEKVSEISSGLIGKLK